MMLAVPAARFARRPGRVCAYLPLLLFSCHPLFTLFRRVWDHETNSRLRETGEDKPSSLEKDSKCLSVYVTLTTGLIVIGRPM